MRKNPNVLLVAASGDYTGAAKMAHLYGTALRREGWHVSYLVGKTMTNCHERLADKLAGDGFIVNIVDGFYNFLPLNLILRTKKIIRRISPDIVVSCVQADLKVIAPVCLDLGIPFVILDQTIHRFYGSRLIRLLKEWAFGRYIRRACAVVAVSEAVAREAINRFGCHEAKVTVVPNGIETCKYLNRSSFGPSSVSYTHAGPLKLLSIGRIDEQKGHVYLVEAISLCRDMGVDVVLSIAGDISPNNKPSALYRAKIERLIKTHNLSGQIHLIGWQANVPGLLPFFDAYIHSALWEGFPLGVIEAMAGALPVVMTDCVGRPPGFNDGTHGWVVKAGNSQHLATAIKRLYQLSAEARYQMGLACRKLATEKYDISMTDRCFVEICHSVLQRR